MFWLGLIVGIMLGFELNNYVNKIKGKENYNIFGFELVRSKTTGNKKIPDAAKKRVDKKCNLCNDEDMFVAGTKNLIACPECNRNKHKFKTLYI